MAVAYLRNAQSVVSETFEDDTVLINFEKGTYFSLRGSAPRIWDLLSDRPMTLEAIVAAVVGAASAEESAKVQSMLDTLATEGCVLVGEAGQSPSVGQSAGRQPDEPFEPPLVQAFHDLKELIVIDPVHEVDEFDGWPNRPGPLAIG
jgi:hypothetical protein